MPLSFAGCLLFHRVRLKCRRVERVEHNSRDFTLPILTLSKDFNGLNNACLS
jgi:hypothetical protein